MAAARVDVITFESLTRDIYYPDNVLVDGAWKIAVLGDPYAARAEIGPGFCSPRSLQDGTQQLFVIGATNTISRNNGQLFSLFGLDAAIKFTKRDNPLDITVIDHWIYATPVATLTAAPGDAESFTHFDFTGFDSLQFFTFRTEKAGQRRRRPHCDNIVADIPSPRPGRC